MRDEFDGKSDLFDDDASLEVSPSPASGRHDAIDDVPDAPVDSAPALDGLLEGHEGAGLPQPGAPPTVPLNISQ
eukprot:8957882-Pyramimonas_sp.AAC.1